MGRPTLASLQLSAIRAIQGVRKNFSGMASVPLDGTPYTPDTLIAFLQGNAELITALSAAHDQLHALVAKEATMRVQFAVVLRCLEAFVINLYGADPAKMGEFGLSPRKVGKEDVATRAAAIEKGKATRLARHTMGPRARLAITGESPAQPAPTAPASPSQTSTATAVVASGVTNGAGHAKA